MEKGKMYNLAFFKIKKKVIFSQDFSLKSCIKLTFICSYCCELIYEPPGAYI